MYRHLDITTHMMSSSLRESRWDDLKIRRHLVLAFDSWQNFIRPYLALHNAIQGFYLPRWRHVASSIVNVEEVMTFATEGGRRICFHPFLSVSVSRISQKVVDGFRLNLMDELVKWWEQANSILEVWIQIRPISGIQNLNWSAWSRYALHLSAFLVSV